MSLVSQKSIECFFLQNSMQIQKKLALPWPQIVACTFLLQKVIVYHDVSNPLKYLSYIIIEFVSVSLLSLDALC